MANDFDGMSPALTDQQTSEDHAVQLLQAWVRRTRQICEELTKLDVDYPNATSNIIVRANAGQEAKLRVIWGILQNFATLDPATDPVPDLPA